MTTPLAGLDLERVAVEIERTGAAVLPGVLSSAEVEDALQRLWLASAESERRGFPTHLEGLDPNSSNVRVFNLVDLDPLFCELLDHPVADAIVARLLGDDYIVSNFTANIARPGSKSMAIHSDQSIVAPEPWLQPWAINIIWCLSDIRAENGATQYIPGSHHWRSHADLPAELESRLVSFEAPAGAIVAMEGRVWHTSGANVTQDEDRPLLFGYYTKPFLRPQINHSVGLRPEVQARCSATMRYRLGLDLSLNAKVPRADR